MFGLDITSPGATWMFVAAAVFFVVVVWSAPSLHRLILPASLHDNSLARAAAIAFVLVAATVTATIAMRSSTTNAEAETNPAITIEQMHRNVDLHGLPIAPPPEAF